jgi:hypothetical protein
VGAYGMIGFTDLYQPQGAAHDWSTPYTPNDFPKD